MTPVEIGARMWSILAPTFDKVMDENRIVDVGRRAQLWAGFVAGTVGAMSKDIGCSNANTVLAGVKDAIKVIAAEVEHSKVSH